MPDDNRMRIEPGAAERIARAFETHADNLTQVSLRLEHVGHSTGFAGFPSANELDIGFKNKARQAVANLREQIDLTRQYAAEIRAAGAAYVEAESVNAIATGTAGTALDSDSSVG